MTRIDHARLFRARLRAFLRDRTRPPWVLIALFVGDLLELAGSVALAALNPAPPITRTSYPTFDVPAVVPATTMGVAMLGIGLGLVMGASLVGELVVLYRRAQIVRWRHRPRATPRHRALTAPGSRG